MQYNTREIVDERDLDRAADDGVNPKPPSGAENCAGDPRAEDG